MSEPIVSKTEWLERIERARMTWESLVAEIDAAMMVQPNAFGVQRRRSAPQRLARRDRQPSRSGQRPHDSTNAMAGRDERSN